MLILPKRQEKNYTDGWINIWKYWEELVIKIGGWHSSVSKFTFELGEGGWLLPLDSARVQA